MKSLSLLKSPINEKLKIIHIYGTKALKEKLRSLAIDINSNIYIIDKTDEIIIENTNNQQLSLSFDDASDIFTIRQYAIYESNFNFKKKLIFCLSSLLCLLLFIIIGLLINYNFFKISLELNASTITIEYGTHFDASKYVKYVKNANLTLPILPNNDIGQYQLTYKASNKLYELTKNLTVNIVDTKAPQIILKTTSVNYDQLEDCYSYIEEINDNHDKNLLTKVKCSNNLKFDRNNQATISYEVMDSSLNLATNSLTIIKPLIVEKPIIQTVYQNNNESYYETYEEESIDTYTTYTYEENVEVVFE
ncbi:MAG: hypothetical protein PUH85_05475 [Firmicutes bacterium]|nr:hypothetical protein [Erysipelotrichaceae bacterium]MDD7227828.1 hypothetical protein [Bacillota bacterium]MDY4972271.1 hypothetical protein [Erysipelotrichaceae bacterium]